MYQNSSNLVSSFNSCIDDDEWLNTEFAYDSLERLTTKYVNLNDFSKIESYEYFTNGTATTSFVSAHTVDGVSYTYTYDSVGNITAVRKNGALKYAYSYDKLGQLTEAVIYSDTYSADYIADIYSYSYDKSGNILSVTHTYGEDASYYQTTHYSYDNASWGDLLTNYNGTAITYDAIGNPLKWRNAQALEWNGRQLTLFGASNGEVYTYTYNADGIRTSKTVYDASGDYVGTTEYIYDGTKLIAESRSGDWLYYFYDASGAISGMSYNGTLYYFRKNLQGDVTGIYNASGNIIAQYEYTPYGAIFAITDANGNDISTNATHIANVNPFRYRGYYYDTETGFYYLQTRYYDPVIGRFINADAFVSTGQGILGNNMFAYCLNNPVLLADYNGEVALVACLICMGVSLLATYTCDVIKNIRDGYTGANMFAFRSSFGQYLESAIIGFVGPCGAVANLTAAVLAPAAGYAVDETIDYFDEEDIVPEREYDLEQYGEDVLFNLASYGTSTALEYGSPKHTREIKDEAIGLGYKGQNDYDRFLLRKQNEVFWKNVGVNYFIGVMEEPAEIIYIDSKDLIYGH